MCNNKQTDVNTGVHRCQEVPGSILVSLGTSQHWQLSLVVELTVAPPRLNKGNLSPLRSSSFHRCLLSIFTLHFWCRNLGEGKALASLLPLFLPLSLFSLIPESGSMATCQAYFLPGLISSLWGRPVPL